MISPALTLDELRALAAAGGAAPSLHNSQPWRFRPSADRRRLEVYADYRRAVPVTDPDGRALHISIGAALLNLRVAAVHHGRAPVLRLQPGHLGRQPIAELDLAEGLGTGPEPFGRNLYPAVFIRHSSRQPFANRDVPEVVLGELLHAAAAEGAQMTALEESEVRRVLDLTAEAEARIAGDVARQAETRTWLRPEAPAVDGIPATALGPQDHDARVPMRSFTGRPPAPAVLAPPPTRRFEALPQLATLTTRGDRPADWLRAGQAMERVWLLATLYGLRVSVLHQAVEWPDTRGLLRDPEQGPGHVQLVLRFGYGPPGAATPRRPVDEILDLPAAPGSAQGA
ncbi:Acg family FMN-binding oxidoreductase, partial [Streptomyces sp. NRRL B-24484]|uniref:Acg family FMN-binding oxidoreductase n=1 Tax=Streptomyces sp. NRRL B-24484 TaxID=1463833 RepID=UPI0004BE589A